MIENKSKFNCRYFSGYKPCKFNKLCQNCDSFNAIGKRILIIKLASVGDVLRTTAILSSLKKKYAQSHITWLVNHPAEELLLSNAYLDRILIYNLESALQLQVEKFDLVISLDKAVEAVSLATLVTADEKFGFGLNEQGKIYPLNKEAEYSFALGLSNDLKFRKNKKSYQELTFDITKIKYKKEHYELKLGENELIFAKDFFERNNISQDDVIIGINTGAGKVFANKNLRPGRIIELIKLLNKELDGKILLLGGPQEKTANERIIDMLDFSVLNSGGNHNLREFAALVERCTVVIAPDTLAMHLAIALKKPVIALFGPTCHQEVELYTLGKKIISNIECAPCYKNTCDKVFTCMDKIKLMDIVVAAKELVNLKVVARI